MKQESNSSKIYLEQEELDRLLTEVKETLATDSAQHGENRKVFSAADLWNSRRMKKEYQRRSKLWN